jgi:hypothetical protein
MAKTWVLDTETKGTGAHISPLKEETQPSKERDLELVSFGQPPRPARQPVPITASPLRFKVVDVRSAQVLAEDVDAQGTIELLEGMSSVVDARIYVWALRTGRWRLLSLDEQKALWRFRGSQGAAQT